MTALSQSSSQPQILARLNSVTRRFPNGTIALQNCSLTITDGERLSILGPSGCGKSTALRLIAGLDLPDAGQVHQSVADSTGFVFQDPTLLPWASALDNVALPLKLKGIPSRERKDAAEHALEQVGLGEFTNAWPRELSGGMKMRVSIARALVLQPRLLLMDEPFAALDEITRFKLNDILLERQEAEGFALVFVTHSVFESVYISQRVAIMSQRPGQIVQNIATAPDVLRDASFRETPNYARLCVEVSKALKATDSES